VASRELYWNIEGHSLIYPMFFVAMAFFFWGLSRHFRIWRQGVAADYRSEAKQTRLKETILQTLSQRRVLASLRPGIMHACLFWGFLALLLTTLVIALQTHLSLQFFKGSFYLFLKLLANTAGLLMLAGLAYAVCRRFRRPSYLSREIDDYLSPALLIFIILTGFLLESARMAAVPDPWGIYGYVGYLLAPAFRQLPPSALLCCHTVLWWLHMLLTMFFIGWLPWSKLAHIVLGPAGVFLRRREMPGVPQAIDFAEETLVSFGKNKAVEFSWKLAFDASACVRCGRCQQSCPASLSGKHLNPRQVLADFRACLQRNPQLELAGAVIPEADIWTCTTCRACEESCPFYLEHTDRLLELRRYLALTESRFPAEVQRLFKNLGTNGNAWGIGFKSRAGNYAELGLTESAEPEILLWPGCTGAFDERSREVWRSLIMLLDQAGVKYSTLGNREKCCGDPARRLGNEYIFQTLAAENIASLKAARLKKIITTCPHCLHMLKEEYPAFGFEAEVLHHSQYLLELAQAERLKLPSQVSRITFHDPCYLSRYAGILDEPRRLLTKVGATLVEAPHHHKQSLCCGAGGGRMWLEEDEGKRINEICCAEHLALNAPIVTACPFCLTMLRDGVAASSRETQVLDLAEVLSKAMT
jgi:Fe-S oxidoreductase/nitrate reductase gamma subunit